eukprot:EC692692.1.p1 GENE.EC692692.1~~EC692692.1.p1  ORF type:complete len:218 (+),score=41.45 EC692692.1:80-733(+)
MVLCRLAGALPVGRRVIPQMPWRSSSSAAAPIQACRLFSSSPELEEPEVLFSKEGYTNFVILNRPKALNALNLPMIRAMFPEYQIMEKANSSRLVILAGAGEKAFCAGGDVKALYLEGVNKAGTQMRKTFFREEYQLNFLIGTLRKPHVSILDGVTMGGGVGLSVHGHFRVATENTVFAMPETGIGFYTDVGGSYFLLVCRAIWAPSSGSRESASRA